MKLYLLLIIIALASCSKSSFLDEKPELTLVVPGTIEDFQAILDNDMVMNGTDRSFGLTPALGDAGSDDYYLLDADYSARSQTTKNIYGWNKIIYTGEPDESSSWSVGYKTIFYSNVVLEGISKIQRTSTNKNQWDNIKGSALFYRAFMTWQLAQVFSKQYDLMTAKTDLGIPLRISADVNEKVFRSTNEETYASILRDLNESLSYLPSTVTIKTRPSKAAAYAMLGRTYLSMREYVKAFEYSDLSLSLSNQLVNFSTITSTATFKIPLFNSEVLFHSLQNYSKPESFSVSFSYAKVDSSLVASYNSNDLRKTLFFRFRNNTYSFAGSYTASAYLMTGLTVDEMYLIRAECYARDGKTDLALADLNLLLKNRFKTNTFINYTASTPLEALKIILMERRKELLMRGLRWTDLRRLNVEPEHARTIYRKINGELVSLVPNDSRYTYPIPLSVVEFNKDMAQNER